MFGPAAKASDFHSLEALPRQLSLAPAACSWSSSLSSEPEEQSLWSRLSMDHMMLLVSGCSISNKSRCSDGVGKPAPTSLARAADCSCDGYQLPVNLAGLFVVRQPPLWITVLYSLALVLRAVSTWPWEQQASAVPANRSPLISRGPLLASWGSAGRKPGFYGLG